MSFIDRPSLDKLMTPKERLLEMASANPTQVIAVSIVNNEIVITWDFKEEKHMIGMLNALEDQLKKEIQFRRNKNHLDTIRKYGKKLNRV